MEAWLERWQEGRTGWHEAGGNERLKRYWTSDGRRVLVPLCGKSQDLAWLESRGNEVVGVELSDIAARAFFEENAMDYRVVPGDLIRYEAVERRISIVCGDYFDFSDGPFDACYDRGALAALSPTERPRYAAHTRSLLTPDAYLFLIVLEYDQVLAQGPPWCVAGNEVQGYWPGLVRACAIDDLENCPPKFRDAGLTEMLEVVWRSG